MYILKKSPVSSSKAELYCWCKSIKYRTAILVLFAIFQLRLVGYLHTAYLSNSWKKTILQICGFHTTQVSQNTEWGGDITIHRRRKNQLASGCVSSCRQVDIESNKDTNNCQGVERDKASDGCGGGKGDLSREETERQRETESVLVQSRMLLFIWWLLNK